MKNTIAEKIRQARVMKNLSQENIALELGISVGAYSNMERGKSEVTVSRLYAIAKILKIEVTSLLLVKPDAPNLTAANYPLLSEKSFVQLNELTEQLNDLKKEVASLKSKQAKKPKRN